MINLEKAVKKFIISNFIFDNDLLIEGDASLLLQGVIDSTGVLELVAFIENSYNIRVKDEEIIPENFDTIDGIVNYLKNKMVNCKMTKMKNNLKIDM